MSGFYQGSYSGSGDLLSPALGLSELFGSQVYCPCASPNACRWLPSGIAFLNALTGGQLTLAGEMPVLCSRGVSTPPVLQLLRDAGLPIPSHLCKFSTSEEYLDQLRMLSKSGQRIVLNHAHPIGDFPAESCWISPQLLNYLNNKANLEELVPDAHVPERSLYMVEQLRANVDNFKFPVVIKAAVNETSGAGVDIKICRNRADVERLPAEFCTAERLVMEEYFPEFLNLCLNYVLMADGQVVYCGCAEQVSDEHGFYQGNWLDRALKLPELVLKLGNHIADKGVAAGYYGFMGIDVALLPGGQVMAFDLNFRANGSTTALLFSESIVHRTGKSVMRLRSWRSRIGYRHLLKIAYSLLQSGSFLPLWSYDPRADGLRDSEARLGGLLIGFTREEVQDLELEIASRGLE